MGSGEWQNPFRAGVGNGEWGVAEPHGCNPRPDPLLTTPSLNELDITFQKQSLIGYRF